MAMSSSLAGAGVAGAVVAALAAAVLGSGAGLEPALGMPARKRNIKIFFSVQIQISEDELQSNFGLFATSSYVCRPELFIFLFF